MVFKGNSYYQEKFAHLSLTNEVIKSKSFEECEFISCSFLDCKFEKIKFLNTQFTDCILSAVVPMDCRLNGVRFFRSKAIGIDWTKAEKIRDLEFKESQINYSSFKLLAIPKTKLVKCEAKEVDFTETDLSHGDFKDTDFEKSRFFKSNLAYADFKGARNYYIDARVNTLKQTRFCLPEALSLLDGLDIIVE
jgi:fluoroquinolone resistance protein